MALRQATRSWATPLPGSPADCFDGAVPPQGELTGSPSLTRSTSATSGTRRRTSGCSSSRARERARSVPDLPGGARGGLRVRAAQLRQAEGPRLLAPLAARLHEGREPRRPGDAGDAHVLEEPGRRSEPNPPLGGPIVQWHLHTTNGKLGRLKMSHVWLVPGLREAFRHDPPEGRPGAPARHQAAEERHRRRRLSRGYNRPRSTSAGCPSG